jgi:hypothetical protein
MDKRTRVLQLRHFSEIMASGCPTAVELAAIANGDAPGDYRDRARARWQLVRLYSCHDCGVAAGRECLPGYACRNDQRY